MTEATAPLAAYIQQRQITIGALSRATKINKGSLSKICRGDYWPSEKNQKGLGALNAIRSALTVYHRGEQGEALAANGEEVTQILTQQFLFIKKERNPKCSTQTRQVVKKKPRLALTPSEASQPSPPQTNEESQERPTDMLLRKATISSDALQHFRIARDPFKNDVRTSTDVFLSPDVRFVREAMYQTVKNGGMLAVVGESGSGKSTLRRELVDRLERETGGNYITIEPYVIGMEENDSKGKTLKADAIAQAIISAVSPLEPAKRSSQARFQQLHRLLKASAKSGTKHILIIEEAHCLPKPTLKHLKRFIELENGFTELLSIILIGQPELKARLSEKDEELREVVQRCQIVDLLPLNNNLEEYLRFKFARVDVQLADLFEPAAIETIRQRMTIVNKQDRGFSNARSMSAQSLLYPLAVANIVSQSINNAYELGAPKVTADIVKEV